MASTQHPQGWKYEQLYESAEFYFLSCHFLVIILMVNLLSVEDRRAASGANFCWLVD